MNGKKIGIIAFVCAILFAIFAIIAGVEAPEIREETYKMAVTDYEEYMEMYNEDIENASTLFKIANVGMSVTGLVGIVLSIVSLVKISKEKEKGKVFAILAIIIIIVFYFVATFSLVDFGEAFQAGLEYGQQQ